MRNPTKKITIKGIIQKKDLVWTANIPVLKISSHSLTPGGCLKNVTESIKELLGQGIALEAKINDEGVFHISSHEAQKFLEFILQRIMCSDDCESIMEKIQEYVIEEV